MHRRIVAAIMSLIFTVSMFTGCSGEKVEPVLDPGITVNVEEVGKGRLEKEGKYVAVVSAAENVEVIPLVSGKVEKINVQAGQTVSAGSVLCNIDDSSAKYTLESAKASYKSSVDSAEATKNSNYILAAEQEQNNIESQQKTAEGYQAQIEEVNADKGLLSYRLSEAQRAMDEAEDEYRSAKKKLERAQRESDSTVGDSSDIDRKVSKLQDKMAEKKSEYQSKKSTYESLCNSYDTSQKGYDDKIASLERSQEAAQQNIQHSQEIQAINNTITYRDKQKNAENSVASAKISLEQAEYQLSLYTITAPMSGKIEEVNVTENNYASSGQPAFVITSDDEKIVTFYVTEDVKDSLEYGQKVTCSYHDKEYEGNITEIGTAVDEEKGLFKIKAAMPSLKQASNGVSVEVSLVTEKTDSAVIVPFDSVNYDNGNPYVYLLNEDGTAVKRDIAVDIHTSDRVAVVDGLKDGDKVITSWSASLRDGVSVNAVSEVR